MPIPTVIERTARGERAYDIYSRLLRDRIVFLTGPIDDAVSSSICAQLLYLEAEDSRREISLYVNSPGGSLTDALAIYDTMQYLRPEVATLALGQACSAAALLVASGAPGKRRALPNAKLLLRQPVGDYRGQATEVDIHAREILATRARLHRLLAKHARQSLDTIEETMARDRFFSAEDAKAFGLIDTVLESRRHGHEPSLPIGPAQAAPRASSRQTLPGRPKAVPNLPIPFSTAQTRLRRLRGPTQEVNAPASASSEAPRNGDNLARLSKFRIARANKIHLSNGHGRHR